MSNAVEVLIRRDRAIVRSAVGCLVALSWLILAIGHGDVAIGWGVWPFAAAFTMWMIMMVAMMLPPVMPWITLFASTRRRRDAGRLYGETTVFVAGYFSVWLAFCVMAAAVQLALQELTLLPAGTGALDRPLAGALLAAAGAFQLTPLKAACLRHCRSPIGFFLSRWQDGPMGAWRMGATHGLYCLGCCWALMLLSFALGVMNVLWMAALTFTLCVEKIAPAGDALGRAFGVMLICWGAWLMLSQNL